MNIGVIQRYYRILLPELICTPVSKKVQFFPENEHILSLSTIPGSWQYPRLTCTMWSCEHRYQNQVPAADQEHDWHHNWYLKHLRIS